MTARTGNVFTQPELSIALPEADPETANLLPGTTDPREGMEAGPHQETAREMARTTTRCPETEMEDTPLGETSPQDKDHPILHTDDLGQTTGMVQTTNGFNGA